MIGNADRRHLFGAHAGLRQSGFGRGQLCVPDFLGIVLDPAGLRVILFELLLRQAAYAAVMIEDDAAAAGRALVQCQNEFHFPIPLVRHG